MKDIENSKVQDRGLKPLKCTQLEFSVMQAIKIRPDKDTHHHKSAKAHDDRIKR